MTPPEILDRPALEFISMIRYISAINREELAKYNHELARLRR